LGETHFGPINKAMRRRGPLYDTRTYKLENKDLSQGVFLALAALALAYFSTVNNEPWSWALAGGIAYLGVLLASSRTRLWIPTILALGVLVLPLYLQETIRLIFFTLVIGLTPRKRSSINALFVLILLWAVYLSLPAFPHLLRHLTPTIGLLQIKEAFLEIAFLQLIVILLWSKVFPSLFGRLSTEIDLSAVIFCLLLLATICGGALAVTGFLYTSGSSLDDILSVGRAGEQAYTLLLLGIIAVPLALSAAIMRLAKDYISRVQLLIGNPDATAPAQLYPKINDFISSLSSIRDFVDTCDRHQREAELKQKNMLSKFEEREKELLSEALDAHNIAAVMTLAPVGYIAVSGTGALLSSSPTLDSQFGIQNSKEQIGEHFSSLRLVTDSTAAARFPAFQSFIARIISEQKDLVRNQPLQSYVSLSDETYCQMTVYLIDGHLLPVDAKRISSQIAPSDLSIVVFTEIRDDIREFILDQFLPSGLEILGGQSLDSVREIGALVEDFASKYHLSPSNLEQLRTISAEEMEAEIRLIDRGAKELIAEIKSLTLDHLRIGHSICQPNTEDEKKKLEPYLVSVDLTKECEKILKLFDELVGQNVETQFIPPTVVIDGGEPKVQSVMIKSSKVLLQQLFGTLVSTLSAISKRTQGVPISVSVGTEQIGQGTAALFRGSHPGRYARIVISHKGQSITTNMLPDSIRRVSPPETSENPIEALLAILSLQVERMNGFFSIQSSPGRGTQVTVYLPDAPIIKEKERLSGARRVVQTAIVADAPAEQTKSEPQPLVVEPPTTNTISQNSILIVSDDQQLTSEIKNQLTECGINNFTSTTKKKITSALSTPDFSGSGFTESDPAQEIFSNALDVDAFGLIVVSMLGELSEGMKLLKLLSPDRPILIVASDPDSADALSSIHRVVTYPIQKAELSAALRDAGLIN